MNQPTSPGTNAARNVIALGDEETLAVLPALQRLATHPLVVSDSRSWPVGALNDGGTEITAPSIVSGLLTAARSGLAIWLPCPGDLGNPSRNIAFLFVAASLGLEVLVTPQAQPWQQTLLPGLAMNHVLRVVTSAWNGFIAAAGAELMAASIIAAATGRD